MYPVTRPSAAIHSIRCPDSYCAERPTALVRFKNWTILGWVIYGTFPKENQPQQKTALVAQVKNKDAAEKS